MEISLIAATTLDGFIARSTNDRSFNWTSSEDKQFYVQHIKSVDAIVMGRKTFDTFRRYPKNSRWILYTSKPEQFSNPAPTVIDAEATNEPPLLLVERLEQEGCQKIAICGGASIYTMFMNVGLVNRLLITVEPLVFGSGISLFNNPIEKKYSQLSLEQIHHVSDQTKVLEYWCHAK